MLKEEFEYYISKQADFVRDYNGMYLVIKGKQLLGAYDTQEAAFKAAKEQHAVGTFLIQYCTPGETAYTHTYHSRVSFR
jgi:hypothetical protein